MTRSTTAAGLFMFLTICSAAHAGLIEYTDRSSFLADAGNTSTIGFEGIAPVGGSVDTCGSLSLGGVQFVGAAAGGQVRCGGTFVLSSSAPPSGWFDWGTGDSLGGDRFGYFQSSGTPLGYLQAFLPANTYAVGTDFWILYDTGVKSGNVLFDVWVGGTDHQFTFSADTTLTTKFEGFISTDPIDSIQYRSLGVGSNAPYGGLDNFTLTSSAPEPNTLILLGLSVALAGGIRRIRILTRSAIPDAAPLA